MPANRKSKSLSGSEESCAFDWLSPPAFLHEFSASPPSPQLTLRQLSRRKQAKLPNHSDIVPIRNVLSYLAIEHSIHVDMLNLEGAPGRLHADQHPAIDRRVRRASVRAAVSASKNEPLGLGDRIQNRQSRIGEVRLNFSKHFPHASTPYLSAMVSAVFGEAPCCRVEVASIERLVKLFGYSQVAVRRVQRSPSLRSYICGVDRVTLAESTSSRNETGPHVTFQFCHRIHDHPPDASERRSVL